MSRVYLYALVREAPKAAGRGITREPLRALRCGKLIAMVGAMKARPVVDEKRLKAHDTVVRRLAESSPAILPARFGSFLEESDLKETLHTRERSLLAALALVRDREQMIVRLSSTSSAPARPPSTPRSSSSSGSSYLRTRRAELAAAQTAPELAPLHTDLVRAERIRRHDRPPLIATAYHLIDRGTAAEYKKRTTAAAKRAKLRIRISGPFPPYAFAPESLA